MQDEPTVKPSPKAKAVPVHHTAPKPAEPKAVEAKAEPPKAASPPNIPMPVAAPHAEPFAKFPASERAAIRAALLWSSGEDGKPGDGEDPMTAAIKAYQKRNKAKVTGILTDAERSDLLAAAKTHHDDFGWSVVVDPATGIRLGVPGKLVPQVREAANGTRWSARHGEVAIETFRIKTAETLNALFEAQKKQPANSKLESSYARGDTFFVSGLQGLKQFAVRAQLTKGELRGYTIFYDQAMEGIMLPVLPAMANAFAPFPEGAAPIATLSRPVAYGTGVIVSDGGHIVTDRRFIEGCDVITVPGIGNAERIATDDAHGLGLLRVYGKQKLEAAALADTPAPRDVRLTGVADPHTQNGNSRRSTIAAQLIDDNAIRLRDSVPLAGFSGAPALDAQGRVLGIMDMNGMQLASTQVAVPPVRFIPAAAIRGFLAAHHVAPAQGNGGESAIVRVICVRH
jgi:S1-C subfamily serine protease